MVLGTARMPEIFVSRNKVYGDNNSDRLNKISRQKQAAHVRQGTKRN